LDILGRERKGHKSQPRAGKGESGKKPGSEIADQGLMMYTEGAEKKEQKGEKEYTIPGQGIPVPVPK